MGLMDFDLEGAFNDPQRAGLLNAAAQMFAASGPSRMPTSFGQVLGNGLLGYQKSLDDHEKRASEKAYREAMTAQAKIGMQAKLMEMDKAKRDAAFIERLLGGQGAAPATPAPVGAGMPDAGSAPSGGAFAAPGGMQGGTPMPQAAPGGGFLGNATPDQIAALKLMGKDVSELYKLAKTGTQLQPGTWREDLSTGQREYITDPTKGLAIVNGRVVALPGFSEANASIKGAEAGATAAAQMPYNVATDAAKQRTAAGLDMVQVPMQDGSMRMMPRLAAAGVLSGPGGAFGPGQGGAPGPGAPGLGVSQSPADKTYGDETAKASAEQYKAIQNAGMQAPGRIAKLQQLGALLDGHDGGKLSPTGLQIAQMANSLGIKIDSKLANKEAAQALTNELALSLRDPSNGGGMPGAMSDADRQFLVASVPGLSQSAQGRKAMVQMQVALTQRNADVAGMARQWQQRYGRLDAVNPNTGLSFHDNLQRWAQARPLFGGMQQPQQQAAPDGRTGSW